jgi:hypothetical protein
LLALAGTKETISMRHLRLTSFQRAFAVLTGVVLLWFYWFAVPGHTEQEQRLQQKLRPIDSNGRSTLKKWAKATQDLLSSHHSYNPLDEVEVEWSTHVELPPIMSAPQVGYPTFFSLLSLIQKWSPDDPDPPPYFKETLQSFNYSDPLERSYAEKFRDAELPFKVYGIPDLTQVSALWSDRYLNNQLEHTWRIYVEKSKNNHFMYWVPEGKVDPRLVPPVEMTNDMKFLEWLQLAKAADRNDRTNPHTNASAHYYFMTSSNPHDNRQYFVSRDLAMFSTPTNNFFITDVEQQKGIQCRFSMRGINMAAHFDIGRNMVAMVKGAKRYILNPPTACGQLDVIADSAHPSYRHSVVDWSDPGQAEERGFGRVEAVDTILRAGEVLYIPSYWFHYIVSTRYSIQCNARSGVSVGDQGHEHIEKCLGAKEFNAYKNRKYNADKRQRRQAKRSPIPSSQKQ